MSAAAGGAGRSTWVLSCEHGGYALPREYGTLGLSRADLRDHIGWDIGAAGVMRELARRLGVPAHASKYSRLLVDCNRAPDEESLIPVESGGRVIPGNARLSALERRRRLLSFHEPYHRRLDRMVATARRRRPGEGGIRLLSVHSFTPSLEGRDRPFDLGVLFDDHESLARKLGRALKQAGFSVRYNEPYSGLDGLIYSARRHGRAHGIPYVELEINNSLVRTETARRRVGRSLTAALERVS